MNIDSYIVKTRDGKCSVGIVRIAAGKLMIGEITDPVLQRILDDWKADGLDGVPLFEMHPYTVVVRIVEQGYSVTSVNYLERERLPAKDYGLVPDLRMWGYITRRDGTVIARWVNIARRLHVIQSFDERTEQAMQRIQEQDVLVKASRGTLHSTYDPLKLVPWWDALFEDHVAAMADNGYNVVPASAVHNSRGAYNVNTA